MIVDFALDTAEDFVSWLVGLFPADFEVPEWLIGLASLVGQVLAGASGMGVWVPWALIITVVAGTYVLWSAGFLVKFARWLLGLLPTMGGG